MQTTEERSHAARRPAAGLVLATLLASAGAAGGQEVGDPGGAEQEAAVERVSPEVRAAAADLAPGGRLRVMAEFEAPSEALLAPGLEAVERYRARAALALAELDVLAATDDVRVGERFWIVPVAALEVTSEGLDRLAGAPGVRRVVSDEPLPVVLEPDGRSFAPPTFTSDAMRTIGADAVWDAGATGEGSVVAFFDSGVDAANAMLGPRWRGRRTPVRASWFDPFRRASAPRDDIGHGTQVAVASVGALQGGDVFELSDGTTIVAASDLDVVTGPAPRAEWIAARVFDDFGGAPFTRRSVLLQAFQWALDPDGNPGTDDAPDVINASWGILPTGDFDVCTDVLYEAIDAAEGAGVAVLFSAGNGGPAAGSVAFPAARDDAALRSFAVGASSGTTTIAVADFSGRGPSPCGGGIKPEIIAPGTVPEVRADGDGKVRLTGFTRQGTSFSAAQASGAIALLRQARPGDSPEALKRYLIENAVDVGATGPDDDAGHGLLDVPAALGDAGGLSTAGLLQVDGARLDAEGLIVRLENRSASEWPGGRLRVEPVASRAPAGDGPAPASADLPPIPAGGAIMARLAAEGAAATGDAIVRITVTGPGGTPVLSRLVYADPPDGFGGFVLSAGDLSAGANDFGRIGRISAAEGFVWQGRELLPAGGIGVAAGSVVSDGFYATTLGRSDLKRFGPAAETDWAPQRTFTDVRTANAVVRFDDFEAVVPAGLEVAGTYEATESAGVGALGATLTVRNRAGAAYDDLVVGVLADWDLEGGEAIRWVPAAEALVADPASGSGPVAVLASDAAVVAGVALPLGTPGVGNAYEEGSGVLADSLTDDLKLDLLRGGSAASLPGAGTASDNAALLGAGPFDVPAAGEVTVRFWLLAAPDEDAATARLAELRAQEPPPPPGDGGDVFAAEPPFPNPFRPGEGVVRFPYTLSAAQLDAGGDVALEIYDLAGRRLYRDDRPMAPGGATPPFTWDGRLADGRDVASGMYLYVIRHDGQNVSGRVLVMR